MTYAEIKELIKTEIKSGHYNEDKLELFRNEYGYDPRWMPEYTSSADDEEMTEQEIAAIDTIIDEVWNEYWSEDTASIKKPQRA